MSTIIEVDHRHRRDRPRAGSSLKGILGIAIGVALAVALVVGAQKLLEGRG